MAPMPCHESSQRWRAWRTGGSCPRRRRNPSVASIRRARRSVTVLSRWPRFVLVTQHADPVLYRQIAVNYVKHLKSNLGLLSIKHQFLSNFVAGVDQVAVLAHRVRQFLNSRTDQP